MLLNRIPGPEIRRVFAVKAIEQHWSRNVLILQINAGLFERSSTAATNFPSTLRSPQPDLVRESLKDSDQLAFLCLGPDAEERSAERGLTTRVTAFLLELGADFSYIEQQPFLNMGCDEACIDLIFVRLRQRSYVTVKLRTIMFKTKHLEQLSCHFTGGDRQVQQGLAELDLWNIAV